MSAIPSPDMDNIRESVKCYVAALASSGDNFRVAGDVEPVSDLVKQDYINSIMRLITSTTNTAVAAALDRVEKEVIRTYSDYASTNTKSDILYKQRQALDALRKEILK